MSVCESLHLYGRQHECVFYSSGHFLATSEALPLSHQLQVNNPKCKLTQVDLSSVLAGSLVPLTIIKCSLPPVVCECPYC